MVDGGGSIRGFLVEYEHDVGDDVDDVEWRWTMEMDGVCDSL